MFEVYNSLGNIWSEKIYEKSLQLELQAQGLRAERQKTFEVFYFDKRVGYYKMDLLVEDTVIVELKKVAKILPLHQAQLISYLKGYNKPLGILANFGPEGVEHQTFPNSFESENAVTDRFDYDKINLRNKERIKDLLLMANRIFTTLGAGYFHQVYRRVFHYELSMAGVDFVIDKELKAFHRNTPVGSIEVNFFRMGDLLLSVVAVDELDRSILLGLRNCIKALKCRRGLIFNFKSTILDFRYFEL